MPKLIACIKSWYRSCDGATAVEYGLVAAGIALAIAVAVFSVGDSITGMFADLTSYFKS